MKDIKSIAREERLAYMKEWRAKNKDKVRESNKRYWEKKARERIKKESNKPKNDLLPECLSDDLSKEYDLDLNSDFDFDLDFND